MIYIEQNIELIDNFVVLDEDDNPVIGLSQSNFTIKLYNPNDDEVANVSGGNVVTINEVGNGLYEISFIPELLGSWEVLVYHTTYFPWGKAQNYKCVESLGGIKPELEDAIYRILGLNQENFRTINHQYDRNNNLISCNIKIYPTPTDVENDTNAIATYLMTANFNIRNNQMTNYKVKKVS